MNFLRRIVPIISKIKCIRTLTIPRQIRSLRPRVIFKQPKKTVYRSSIQRFQSQKYKMTTLEKYIPSKQLDIIIKQNQEILSLVKQNQEILSLVKQNQEILNSVKQNQEILNSVEKEDIVDDIITAIFLIIFVIFCSLIMAYIPNFFSK